jgi:tetratricopeptide (TPR) repeat protein
MLTRFFALPFVITCIFFLASCNQDNKDVSPYEELVSAPPYATLTDSIHRFPDQSLLYYKRGVLLLNNSNLPPALADFKKAWSLEKKESYAIGTSTVLLEGKPDSAISFLDGSLKLFPNSIPLQLNLAEAYSKDHKNADAIAVCDKILAHDPAQLDALQLKSGVQDVDSNTLGSIKTLEQAYHYYPANEEVCFGLAFKYAQAKNPATIRLCDSIIHVMKEKKAEPFYFKGLYFANTGNSQQALALFNQAIIQDYGFIDAYMDKGKIYFDAKKYNEAAKVYELLLTISPGYADAYFWLGKSQEALGQKDEAKQNYERAYGLDKGLGEAKERAGKL